MLHLPDKRGSKASRGRCAVGAKRDAKAGDHARAVCVAGQGHRRPEGYREGEGRAGRSIEEVAGHRTGNERRIGEGDQAQQGQGDAQGAGVDRWQFGSWLHPRKRKVSVGEVLALCDGITSNEALMAAMLLNVAGFWTGEIGSALMVDNHQYNSLFTDGIEAWRHDPVFRAEYDRLVKEVNELYRMAA